MREKSEKIRAVQVRVAQFIGKIDVNTNRGNDVLKNRAKFLRIIKIFKMFYH